MNKHIKYYRIAQSFLTRIPVNLSETITDKEIGRSALYYPFVGIVIGLILMLVAWSFSFAEPLLVAVIITVVWAVITGALHLDGLADTADAWLGGHADKERIFTIMKDPRSGTAGVTAIVLILLIKVAALMVLVEHSEWLLILLIPVIARLGILALIYLLPSAKPEGLAYTVKRHLPYSSTTMLLFLLSVGLLVLSPISFIFAAAIFFLLQRMMLKQIGGMTGDTLGASVEIVEAMTLLFMALIS